MPPRIVGAAQAGGGVANFLDSIPPITRAMAVAIFASALGAYLGVLNPFSIALIWPQITKSYHIWRLFTCHTFMPFGMPFVFNMLFLIKYGGNLESEAYRFNPADFLFMLICGASFLMSLPLLMNIRLFFTTQPLIMMIIYVWSRYFPDQQVSIYGLVTIQSFYLPFAFLAITVLMGGSPVLDICGIIAGHLWYFFTVLYPQSSGRTLVRTPKFLTNWVSNMGVGPAPNPQEQQQRSAFRGRGQRLGTQ